MQMCELGNEEIGDDDCGVQRLWWVRSKILGEGLGGGE